MFWIIRYIRKLFKCGICKATFSFEDEYIVFREQCRCSVKVRYDEIKYIIYTVIGNKCFVDVVRKDQDDCYVYRTLLAEGLEIDIRGEEIGKLVHDCNKNEIILVPTIKVCNIPYIDSTDSALSTLTFLNKAGLIHIVDASDESVTVGLGMLVWKKVKMEYDILFDALGSYARYYNDTVLSCEEQKSEFWIEILDASYTLDRGYGLYPMLGGEVMLSEIYYSFNKKEIKKRMIELFEKYNRTIEQ